jgi:peptidoglycan/xylan/chitin deacetylase (PgdA/CDA1 family)
VLALLAVVGVLAVLDAGGTPVGRARAAASARHHQHQRGATRRHSSRAGAALAGLDARGNARIRALAKLGLPVFCGGTRGNAVAFTFDDGPGPYTYLALRKLSEAHERATFFLVGRSMDAFPNWARRELAVAALGDHTYTHPVLPELSSSAIETELETTRLKIQHSTGQPVDLFRPPYGAFNQTVLQTARRLGLLPILWTADSRDSLGANWAGIIQNVTAALHPGEIILMHENRGQTIRALTTLLPLLHKRHLRSVSLPELFATDPPSVAQLKRGSAGCGVKPVTTTGQ